MIDILKVVDVVVVDVVVVVYIAIVDMVVVEMQQYINSNYAYAY